MTWRENERVVVLTIHPKDCKNITTASGISKDGKINLLNERRIDNGKENLIISVVKYFYPASGQMGRYRVWDQ